MAPQRNVKTAQESKRRPSNQSNKSSKDFKKLDFLNLTKEPKSKTNLSTEKDINATIEKVKVRQNKEMLQLLEAEQKLEKDRERKLQEIADPQDRKRMEKILAMERTRSHAKVQQLME